MHSLARATAPLRSRVRWRIALTPLLAVLPVACERGAPSTASPAPVVSTVSSPGVSSTSSPRVDEPFDKQFDTVVLLGDSLLKEALPYLHTELTNLTVVDLAFGGTAACDGLGLLPMLTSGTVAVLSYTGNSLTPCMAVGGTHLKGDELLAKYHDDVATLVQRSITAGASVLLVGQPVRSESHGGNEIVDDLNAFYEGLADATPTVVHFVDAGAAVEGNDGSFTPTLPCLVGERECGPGGYNVVRSNDGLHFCPGLEAFDDCTTYSSGAYRFAMTIAAALIGR